MIHLKRAYEKPDPRDGARVLIDRLWPRGVTRQRAAIDLWLKEIAPTPELRRWFAHDPAKWEEFDHRYREELRANPELIATLRKLLRQSDVTLIYAARDKRHNGAVILKALLNRRKSRTDSIPSRGS